MMYISSSSKLTIHCPVSIYQYLTFRTLISVPNTARQTQAAEFESSSGQQSRIKGRNSGRFRRGAAAGSGQQGPTTYGAQPPPGMGETDLSTSGELRTLLDLELRVTCQ